MIISATEVTFEHTVKMTIAYNLRELRTERGWSQEMLATFAGIHPTEGSRLERGLRQPRVATLARLAIALGVDIGALLITQPGRRSIADAHTRTEA